MDNSNKDDEYLLWIAKRLVFKYNESQEIIKQVSRIIAKNRVIKTICYENYKNNQIGISKTIEYLSKLQKINDASLVSVENKTTLTFHNDNESILETLDIDSFLKGV